MQTEAIVGFVILLIVNIIGWYLTGRRASMAVHDAADAAKQAAADELSAIKGTVRGLPCVVDNNYMKDMGRLLEKVDHMEKQLDTIIVNGKK